MTNSSWMTRFLLFVLLTVALAERASAWGQKGHDTTCSIAERHLTKKAKRLIADLLDGRSIVYWSNWLDNVSHTPQYSYTKTWHYKNIDAGQTFDEAPLLETGDVVRALDEQTARLKSGSLSREEKQLALKMVIHLMGDLHQPMHMGHKSDLGGNKWFVGFFGENLPLHTVWDENLVERAHAWSHTEWTEELDRADKASVLSIQQGTFTDWARETHRLATAVYDGAPQGSTLSYDYVAQWTPIVEQQFLRGGLRLARVLNEIFE